MFVQTEKTPKQQRAAQTVESLMQLAPPLFRNMIPVFMPQFQAQFDNVTDEEIDQLLNKVRSWLDYIEKGE